MILDLPRFLERARPGWDELDRLLDTLEENPRGLSVAQVRRLHFLYEQACGDLARLQSQAAEREVLRYLEALVARAHSELLGHRPTGRIRSAWTWTLQTFPRVFRHHGGAFAVVTAVFLAGALFGAGAITFDPPAKGVLMPFSHLHGDPSDRVSEEEAQHTAGTGGQVPFSGMLMTHNTRVAILSLALGMTWGVGTLILEFYNGIILGAVALDYVRAGEAVFLMAWLLPHGSIEIPAFLIAGQAGLVLASALLGGNRRLTLAGRLRAIRGDLVTLIAGVALLLVWAGIIEAFFSQHHEPVLPYSVKIAFGVLQLACLVAYLSRAGGDAEVSPEG